MADQSPPKRSRKPSAKGKSLQNSKKKKSSPIKVVMSPSKASLSGIAAAAGGGAIGAAAINVLRGSEAAAAFVAFTAAGPAAGAGATVNNDSEFEDDKLSDDDNNIGNNTSPLAIDSLGFRPPPAGGAFAAASHDLAPKTLRFGNAEFFRYIMAMVDSATAAACARLLNGRTCREESDNKLKTSVEIFAELANDPGWVPYIGNINPEVPECNICTKFRMTVEPAKFKEHYGKLIGLFTTIFADFDKSGEDGDDGEKDFNAFIEFRKRAPWNLQNKQAIRLKFMFYAFNKKKPDLIGHINRILPNGAGAETFHGGGGSDEEDGFMGPPDPKASQAGKKGGGGKKNRGGGHRVQEEVVDADKEHAAMIEARAAQLMAETDQLKGLLECAPMQQHLDPEQKAAFKLMLDARLGVTRR